MSTFNAINSSKMYLKKYSDLAFGTDDGMLLQEFIEGQKEDVISLEDIYLQSDLKKYLDHPELLKERKDTNVSLFMDSAMEVSVHYEDFILVLAVLLLEAKHVGQITFTEIGGDKTLVFNASKDDCALIYKALLYIHSNPNEFILFEYCGAYLEELLGEINEVLEELRCHLS